MVPLAKSQRSAVPFSSALALTTSRGETRRDGVVPPAFSAGNHSAAGSDGRPLKLCLSKTRCDFFDTDWMSYEAPITGPVRVVRVEAIRRHCRIPKVGMVTTQYVERHPVQSRTRKAKIGNNTTVEPPVACDYGYNISVGNNVHISQNCTMSTWPPSPDSDGLTI